jgi:pimeloyl-ACP methyl ester carboxylesterase
MVINANNYKFDCRVSGNIKDELVILLHGFPETSYMYKDLIKDISDSGYYCIAPNLRGYSEGARPQGRDNYTLDKLVNDVLEMINHTGKEKLHLIGHDWGAVIGWQIAHDYPNKLLSWTALSVPHTNSFFNAILNDKEQKKKSYYMWLFQIPILPEFCLKFMNLKILRGLWSYHSKQEINDYTQTLKQKGALTAALNYYRANFKLKRLAKKGQILGDIHVPTLFIWGKHDTSVGSSAAKNSYAYIKADYQFLELKTDHWIIQKKYNEAKNSILEHLNSNKVSN